MNMTDFWGGAILAMVVGTVCLLILNWGGVI